jgi:diguanylate cyclase (GGDEF)-like protein
MRHTATTARRTVQIALIGAAVMVLAVIFERTTFERAQRSAMLELLAADHIGAEILLADERLTMSANMAAATGEKRWLARYEANVPIIDNAIRRATELASTPAAREFDAKSRASIEHLIALQRAAFAALQKGDAKGARRLLDSGLYRHNKQLLTESTTKFFESTVGAIRAQLLGLQQRTEIALPLIIVLCGLGAYALWYRLNVSLSRSQTAFVRAEGTIRSLAMNDALTGLANRRAMFIELREAIKQANRDNAKLALLMIDLDRFKPINDQHGHLTGDLVLKQVAYRLGEALPSAQLQARYGGDEFLAVLRFEGDDGIVHRLGWEVVDALQQPMSLDGLTLQIGASVGSAIYPRDAETDEELIRKADLALRHAKRHAPGSVVGFDAAMDSDTGDREQLEAELRAAIAEGGLVPYFQPVIDLRTGKVRGFEILCRWHHPVRGLMQPDEFIPLAESTGLIHELSMSLLRTACLEARALPGDVTLAVNIAPQQIQDASLAHKILAVLSATQFAPHRLEVELTENALVTDLPAAKHVISSLKSLGIRVALDDFGTGYSSLCYLSELPIDMIKIDRSFIRSMRDRKESAKIVTAILGLGKSLNLATIAEGVETERDANFLKAKGCTLAQGNLFGKPMPLGEAAALTRGGEPPAKPQMVA